MKKLTVTLFAALALRLVGCSTGSTQAQDEAEIVLRDDVRYTVFIAKLPDNRKVPCIWRNVSDAGGLQCDFSTP